MGALAIVGSERGTLGPGWLIATGARGRLAGGLDLVGRWWLTTIGADRTLTEAAGAR